MGVHSRHPLQEIQEESNTTMFSPLQHTIPRVTITNSPINENENESEKTDKLPTLTTPPQTVTRSTTSSSNRQQDLDSSFSNDKGVKSKKLKKNNKTTTLLSPAFSSPPQTKVEKSSNLPPPPELPRFVTNNNNNNNNHVTKQKTSSKKEKSQEDIDELNRQVPPPELMPKVIDTSTDFTKKPAYSYAMLIGMSILRAPNRRLTLSQIYNWISDTFKYYKKGDVGWQNSVRHNLSLNKAFVKSAKSKDRKGHFWHIAKDYEYQFYLGKGAAASNSLVPNLQLKASENSKIMTNSTLGNKDEAAVLNKSYSDPSMLYHNNQDDEATSEEEEDDQDDGFRHDSNYTDENDLDDDEDETVRIDVITQTPRSKIIRRQYDDNEFSATKNSSTTLQRYVLHKRTASQDEFSSALQPPTKRRLQPSSAGSGQLVSGSIPNLQPPSPYWSASASGDRVIFGLLKTPPKMQSHSSTSNTTSQSSIFDSPLQLQPPNHPSSIHQGNRYQQFTSSFSCNSNFDLSPLKGTETGPLLEPLTPGQGFSININTNNNTNNTNNNNSNNINNNTNININSNNNNNNSLNPSTPSTLKTPFSRNNLTMMKTPGSSVMKKIWNSPSYLDDFYTSPVVNKGIHFGEEEVVVSSTRAFGSPSKDKKRG